MIAAVVDALRNSNRTGPAAAASASAAAAASAGVTAAVAAAQGDRPLHDVPGLSAGDQTIQFRVRSKKAEHVAFCDL